MAEKFDAIIVGAGPAGTIAAYELAKEGMEILVIERGEYPGAKNVFGGILHVAALNEVFPNFWELAPVERYVTKRVVVFLGEESSVSLEFKSQNHGEVPYNGFTVLRAKFDKWLASKAEDAGALIMTDTRADDLIWKDGKVVGVKVAKKGGNVFADVVIAADGVNSMLAKKANLRKPFSPDHLALGVKEVWELPEDFIESYFDLTANEGAAHLFIGQSTGGIEGATFIYTNRKSVSIGLTCHLAGLVRDKKEPGQLIESFKLHPFVNKIVQNGTMREYSSHLVPEGGIHMLPQVYASGLLLTGDAAGLTMNNGFNVRGADFAIASGRMAARTVLEAKKRADFSAKSLSHYRKLLEDSFVLRDLKTYSKFPGLMKNKAVFKVYPEVVCELIKEMYDVDNRPKKKPGRVLFKKVKERMSIRSFCKDVISVIRAMI